MLDFHTSPTADWPPKLFAAAVQTSAIHDTNTSTSFKMSDSEEGPEQAVGQQSSSPVKASHDSNVRMREDTNINGPKGRLNTPTGSESDGERSDGELDADDNDDDDGGLFGSGSEGEAEDK